MKLSTFCIVTLLGLPLAGQAFAQTQTATPSASPQHSASSGQRKYKVGQRVEYVSNGKWFKSIITKVASDGDVASFGPYHVYRVHPLGFNENEDAWVGDFSDARSQLRPAGSGPTEPVPGGEANDNTQKAPLQTGAAAGASGQPPAKSYHCVYFVVDHLVDAAPFTITGNGTYTDSEGKRGTYTYNPASSMLTFHGGNYDAQRAEYETSGGASRLHILGPSGRRVIDCD